MPKVIIVMNNGKIDVPVKPDDIEVEVRDYGIPDDFDVENVVCRIDDSGDRYWSLIFT